MRRTNTDKGEVMGDRNVHREIDPRTGKTRRLVEFSEAVAELEREFRWRVAREEGVNGFLTFLCTAAPRYLTMMPSIRSEHGRLINAIAALRLKVARAGDHQYIELLTEARAIMGAIDEHEELERELLRDALSNP
jgi:hypothetical protein